MHPPPGPRFDFRRSAPPPLPTLSALTEMHCVQRSTWHAPGSCLYVAAYSPSLPRPALLSFSASLVALFAHSTLSPSFSHTYTHTLSLLLYHPRVSSSLSLPPFFHPRTHVCARRVVILWISSGRLPPPRFEFLTRFPSQISLPVPVPPRADY